MEKRSVELDWTITSISAGDFGTGGGEKIPKQGGIDLPGNLRDHWFLTNILPEGLQSILCKKNSQRVAQVRDNNNILLFFRP